MGCVCSLFDSDDSVEPVRSNKAKRQKSGSKSEVEALIKSSPFVKMTKNVLNCLPSMRSAMDDFYINKIGMEAIETTDDKIIYGFKHNANKHDSYLEIRYNDEFKSAPNYSRDNAYWKIGIGSPDVDTARNQLVSNGIEVAAASQFMDIGYLCDLSDPAGFNIELLQHTFESNFDKEKIQSIMNKDKYKLGSNEVTMSNITLRVCNLEQSLEFYQQIMGMTYLSRQAVDKYGFKLYFLGYPMNENETEMMPKPNDLDAVENREWLWQRPYTTLELQHRWKTPVSKYMLAKDNETGWQGIVFQSKLNVMETKKYLKQFDIAVESRDTYLLKCDDPDGYPVLIECAKN